jgi:type IV pilus assembly protein PilV
MKKTQPRPRRKAHIGRQGFTLIEVLIALAILTVGLLAAAKMQISAIQGNYFSNNTTTALSLAEQKMEDLLGRTYTDAAVTDTQAGNNADLSSLVTKDHEELNVNEEGVVGGGLYHRVWNVADDTPITNTKTITIVVTWGGNERHQVALSCIKRL